MAERGAGVGVGLALACGLLAVPAAGIEPPRPVGAEEFRRDLVGKVWMVELPDGGSATEHVNPDGTATMTGGLEDTGRWRLSEDGFCTTWTRMRDQAERCYTLDRTADGMYRVYKPNGEIAITILEVRAP